MATVKIQGSASGTGSVTIVAPNTNSTRTLTLPDADGVIGGATKAWANLNEQGTASLRADDNVSSITDNGTGDFTLSYSSSLADANYSVSGAANQINGSDFTTLAIASASDSTNVATYTSSATRFRTGLRGVGVYTDMAWVTVQVAR